MTQLKEHPVRLLTPLFIVALLILSGCTSISALREDVRAARERRLEQWKLESAGQSAEQRLLKGPLNLRDSILIALGNSTAIQQAVQDQIKADASIMEAWAEALPTLELGANYTRLGRTPRAGGVAVGSKNNYELVSTARQPLWRGGAISAGIRAARIYSALTDEQYRAAVQSVISDTRKAYLDARLAFELERTSRMSLEAAKRQLEDVKKDKEAGVASGFDVLRAEVEVKNFQAENVRAKNKYNLARTTLLRTINASQQSTIELADALQYRPIQPELSEAVATALLQHPDLLTGEYTKRLQKEGVNVAKSDYWPRLDALFTANRARPHPYRLNHRHSFGTDWSGGLSLILPIFEGFRTVARVRQAQADLRKSEIALKDTEERVLLDVRQAILSIRDAEEFVLSQVKTVEQAEEALRLVRLGRRQGIRKEVEVLDAQSALDQARANHFQSVYDHEIARLALERATGTLTPPESPPFNRSAYENHSASP